MLERSDRIGRTSDPGKKGGKDRLKRISRRLRSQRARLPAPPVLHPCGCRPGIAEPGSINPCLQRGLLPGPTLVILIRYKAVIISPCSLTLGAKPSKQRPALTDPGQRPHPSNPGCPPRVAWGL